MNRQPAAGPLPTGTASIGVGLVVLGVTVYAFLTVSARALGPERYSALSALWALVFLAGPGVFFPVEQEVSRAVATRRVAGVGAAPLVRRAGAAALGLALGLTLVVAAGSGPLLERVFDDQVLVLLGLAASLFGYAALHVVRGVLSGTGRFRAYAVLLGAEGTLRLGAAAILLLLGVRTAGPLALVVGLAPFAAVAVAMAGGGQLGGLTAGPPAPWAELSRSLGFLLVASLLTQVLVHAGPIAVKLLARDAPEELTARFFVGVLLTRVPLFVFFAVQAALLPRLTALAAHGDRSGFREALNKLLAVVGSLGLVSVIGAYVLGQQAVTLLFGSDFVLDDRGLALLAVSTAAIMIGQALGQAVVALDGQAATAACWLMGVATFVAVTAAGGDPELRVEVGLAAGSVAAAAAMAIALVAGLDRMNAPSAR